MRKTELTAIIRKGEKQFVALCPELDVVSQGYSVEEALKNLREACDLYIEEMGLPEGLSDDNIIVTSFGVNGNETSKAIRA
jgi:predicted RNase H-like HicB family nuclease